MSATNAQALPTLLTTAEAARYLRLSVPTLERMRLTDCGLPFIKLGAARGARVVYRRQDLDAFIEAQRRTSTSDRGGHG